MQVFVKTLTGATVTCDVDGSTSIAELKYVLILSMPHFLMKAVVRLRVDQFLMSIYL